MVFGILFIVASVVYRIFAFKYIRSFEFYMYLEHQRIKKNRENVLKEACILKIQKQDLERCLKYTEKTEIYISTLKKCQKTVHIGEGQKKTKRKI